MCLEINKSVKLPKVNEEGYCVGYKLLLRGTNRASFRNDFIYRKGINVSDRPSKELTDEEKTLASISKGIHVFLNFKNTKDLSIRYNGDKIIEVYFKPEDVVATGTFGARHCVVVLKVLVKSLKNLAPEE